MPGRSITIQTACLMVTLLLSFSSKGQSVSQKNYAQQLAVITDNDRYLMQGKDRYYTNGLMLSYSRVSRSKKAAILKQVNEYEIGQKIFTPYSRKIEDPSQIDRPVTGYLYAQYTQSRFIVRNQLWEWGISIGTIGKASLGEAMQNSFHKIIDINTNRWGWIWDYQLKSEPGINLHGRYARGLLNTNTPFLQITPVTQATIGTSFTNLSQGLLIQIGKINPMHQNAYWNASVADKQATVPATLELFFYYHPEIKYQLYNATVQGGRYCCLFIGYRSIPVSILVHRIDKQATVPATLELFFYYHPEIKYQLYNATVQGGLFRNDKGPVTSSIEPLVVMHQVGALFSMDRYTLKLELVLQSKEAGSQRFSHNYGSIQASYRFN